MRNQPQTEPLGIQSRSANTSPMPRIASIFGNLKKYFKATDTKLISVKSPEFQDKNFSDNFPRQTAQFSEIPQNNPEKQINSINKSMLSLPPEEIETSAQVFGRQIPSGGGPKFLDNLISKNSINLIDQPPSAPNNFYHMAINKGKTMKVNVTGSIPEQKSELEIQGVFVKGKSIFGNDQLNPFQVSEKTSRIYLKDIRPEVASPVNSTVELKFPGARSISPQNSGVPINISMKGSNRNFLNNSNLSHRSDNYNVDYSMPQSDVQVYVLIESKPKNQGSYMSKIKTERFRPRQAVSLNKTENSRKQDPYFRPKKFTFGKASNGGVIFGNGTPVERKRSAMFENIGIDNVDKIVVNQSSNQISSKTYLRDSETKNMVGEIRKGNDQEGRNVEENKGNRENETGTGRAKLAGNEVYEGETRNGMRHGKGKLYRPKILTYEGDFISNKFHGQGIVTYGNGRRFEGEFKNDLKEGHGCMYDRKGNLEMEGLWVNDQWI